MKRCSRCAQTKAVDEFVLNRTEPDGRGGWCRPCVAEYSREWRDTPQGKAATHAYYLTRREQQRWVNLLRNWQLTEDDYRARFVAQGGCCAICGGAEPGISKLGNPNPLAVDHDHDTGVIRGLLCSLCNRGLGLFLEDPRRLRAAIRYLAARHK